MIDEKRGKITLEKQNVSPQIFEIILTDTHFYLLNPLPFLLFSFWGFRYIHGGILDVDLQDPELILDVLIAADELYYFQASY